MVETSGIGKRMLTNVVTGKIHEADDFLVIVLQESGIHEIKIRMCNLIEEEKDKPFRIIDIQVFNDLVDHNNPNDGKNDHIKTELMIKLTEVNHVR